MAPKNNRPGHGTSGSRTRRGSEHQDDRSTHEESQYVIDQYQWSEWAWNTQDGFWYRSREDENGKIIYEYDTQHPPPAPLPIPAPSSYAPVTNSPGYLNYQAVSPAQNSVVPIEMGMDGLSLDPSRQKLKGRELKMGNYDADLIANPVVTTYSQDPNVPPKKKWVVKPKDASTQVEALDKNYKVHHSKNYKFGRIFKVLWSEPNGKGKHGTELTDDGPKGQAKYGEDFYHKIRRFLIVRTKRGHSLCLPIHTYGGVGLLKRGVHPEEHAVIFTSNDPFKKDREAAGYSPIKMVPIDSSHKLDRMSRLNYSKVYTVEHNVKVLFIGEVHKKYLERLTTSYDEVHKPLAAIHTQYVGIDEGEEFDDGQAEQAGGYRQGSQSYGNAQDDYANRNYDDGSNAVYATSPSRINPQEGDTIRRGWGNSSGGTAGTSIAFSGAAAESSRYEVSYNQPHPDGDQEQDDIYNP